MQFQAGPRGTKYLENGYGICYVFVFDLPRGNKQIAIKDPPPTHFDESGHQDLLANKSGHQYHGTEQWR